MACFDSLFEEPLQISCPTPEHGGEKVLLTFRQMAGPEPGIAARHGGPAGRAPPGRAAPPGHRSPSDRQAAPRPTRRKGPPRLGEEQLTIPALPGPPVAPSNYRVARSGLEPLLLVPPPPQSRSRLCRRTVRPLGSRAAPPASMAAVSGRRENPVPSSSCHVSRHPEPPALLLGDRRVEDVAGIGLAPRLLPRAPIDDRHPFPRVVERVNHRLCSERD